MVHFIQLESNFETAVTSGSIIKFDTQIALSQTASATPPEDFAYQTDGSIDIFRAGTYTVHWYVTSRAGQSTIGHPYMLKKMDYSLTAPDWVDVAKIGNHIKVSQTPGFAVVDISQDEINNAANKATIALFCEADATVNLTFFAPKAGILIFGLSAESLENTLTTMEGQITGITQQVDDLQQFVHSAEADKFWSETAELPGVGAAVIRSGYTHNFWGVGALNQPHTFVANTPYYIINSAQYAPLQEYTGDATVGTLWIDTQETPPNIFSVPFYFDETGIYFILDTNYSFPAGTIFRFTQALILIGGV